MDRRSFLTGIAKAGFGAIALGGASKAMAGLVGLDVVEAQQRTLHLTITEAMAEMADMQQVYVWTFKEDNLPLSYPGPAIVGTEGETVSLTVTNGLREWHAFAIQAAGIETGPIAPGESTTISFVMPPAGTYLYLDPLNAPINRVLGLHGALVSLPVVPTTPYSDPSATIQELFADLGGEHFPGHAWDVERSWIWLFSAIDPKLHAAIQAGQSFTPDEFLLQAQPRYFTINGRGGYFSAHDPQIAPHGMLGEPGLIRILNAGLVSFSPHIHGNHCYELRTTSPNGITMPDNVHMVDTSRMWQCRTLDWLLPFEMPPDIPKRAECWPPREELAMVLTVPMNPLVYPMHCHCEMSQSANGGNYAAGLITHWSITGDARPGGVGAFLTDGGDGSTPGDPNGGGTGGTNPQNPNSGAKDNALPHPRRDRKKSDHQPSQHLLDGNVNRRPGGVRTVR